MAGAVAFTIKLFAQLRDIAPIICNPAISVVALSVTEVSTFIQIVAPVLGVPEAARHGIVGAVGQPGWTYYLALEDERPVAGAAMFADGIGAWFGLCATLPDARQRGAQTALLDRRITDARKHGCLWISAETAPESLVPNPSLRNMTRIGMRELYHRPWFRFDV